MNASLNYREDIFLENNDVHYDDEENIIIQLGDKFAIWKRYEAHDQGIYFAKASLVPFFNTLEAAENYLAST
jgi:hypothetical protein